jgi:hypothetical protein
MNSKKLSRRAALRAFSAEQQKQQPKPRVDNRCRRWTKTQQSWWMTKYEVEREFLWARSLQATLEELAEFRGSGRRVN